MNRIRLSAFSDEAADSLEGQILALKRNGISLTELRSVDGKNVGAFGEKEAKEISKKLSGEGIGVWSVGSPLGKTDIDVPLGEWTESVKNICNIANILGADKIRAFSFFNAYGKGEKVADRLNAAADLAKTYNVTLYHENEKEVYGDTYERVCELMRKLKDWKFIYDPANFVQCGEESEKTLELVTKCGYYHIKDVIAESGELVPAGEGDGAIERLIGMIDKDAVLTLEPHLAVFGAYSQIDNSEMKHKYSFANNGEAFDAAANPLKKLLERNGYRAENGEYVKP